MTARITVKKYLLTLFMIFSAALVFAAPLDYAHLLIYDDVDKDFFEKFISGEETTYMVCVEEYSNGKQLKDDIAKQIFLDSFDNWLERTKYYISENKKEEDFKDILEILNNKQNLRQLPCSFSEEGEIKLDADLTVVYKLDASDYCGDAISCFLIPQSALIVSTIADSSIEEYKKFVTHELGHAFGLADQYSGAMYDGSFLYNSKVKRPSIMDDSEKVTCDDADGFITSIDRTLNKILTQNKEREFYSLCSDGVFIKNGQAVIREGEVYQFPENYDYFNTEVKISYDTEFDDTYIIDMTLTNFILNQEGLDLIQDMGFNVQDLETLQNATIKIHGAAFEIVSEEDDYFYLRTPTGLWTSVLYLKKGEEYEPKQVITKEYFNMEDIAIITDLETNSSSYIFNETTVPLINFIPELANFENEIPY